jgi:hypothetical protein
MCFDNSGREHPVRGDNKNKKRSGDARLLQLTDSEDWLATGRTGSLHGRSAILELDLLRVLDLPILLLFVYAVSGYHFRLYLAHKRARTIFKLSPERQISGFFSQKRTRDAPKRRNEQMMSGKG